MSPNNPYRNWNVSGFNRGWIFRLAERCCCVIPSRISYALAANLMDWYQGFRPQVSAAVRANLAGAFPRLSPARLDALTDSTFANYGRGLVDYLRAEVDPPEVTARPGAAENLAGPLGGRILVTAHMGNWEVGGLYLGRILGPHCMVGFPESDPGVDAFRETKRSGAGHRTIRARQGLSTPFVLRRLLEEGRSIVVLADRSVDRDRVRVRFRGRPALFLRSPALLSALTGAPVVPVAVMSEGEGRYSAHVGPPAVAAGSDSAGELMQGVADFLGAILEQYPDQWYNFFRYWREEA
jgi:KDO2-lipid IV(A) lauroyltransferase